MKIVFIHGRSQQGKDQVQLKEQWIDSLKEGMKKQGYILPASTEFAFPFYGDRIDELTSSFDIPLSEDIITRGGQVNPEYMQFRADLLETLRENAKITSGQVDIEYGDNPKERGPQNWEWVQAILRALDKHVTGMSGLTLELFTRDVFLYTRRIGVRDEIDSIVKKYISTDPSIIVSHSLGSVVSYNVLRSDPRNLNVILYVTLGSPLGIRSIRNELKPLKVPKRVSDWCNAFDDRDIVALYPLDNKNFPVQPPVKNEKVKNDKKDPHGISGYLQAPEVVKRIYDAMNK